MKPSLSYQHWLDVVSRSFALCIPSADSAAAGSGRARVPAVSRAQHRRGCAVPSIRDFPAAASSSACADIPPRAMPRMRVDVATFRLCLSSGPAHGRRAIRRSLRDPRAPWVMVMPCPRARGRRSFRGLDRMALGMAAYTRRPSPLRLVDVDDVARDCCFVAASSARCSRTCGFRRTRAPGPRAPLAYHFGLFLQRVNILEDLAAGRAVPGGSSCPIAAELLASLRPEMPRGRSSIPLAIPRGDPPYRPSVRGR